MSAVRILRTNKGFSLIELMIVVAIIGILATIAVPNFNRFQAKAKQTEAKSNLAAMYSAQKAFYAEWSTYYGIFADLGFVPEGTLNYRLSFGAQGTKPAGMTDAVGVGSGANCFDTGNAGCTTLNVIRSAAHQGVTTFTQPAAPTTTTFGGRAEGKISESGNDDEWSIDQNKTLTNVTNGI
jgi:type IV pilus assembly protein PilA